MNGIAVIVTFTAHKETRNVFVPTTHHDDRHPHHDDHPQKINLCIVFGVQTVICLSGGGSCQGAVMSYVLAGTTGFGCCPLAAPML